MGNVVSINPKEQKEEMTEILKAVGGGIPPGNNWLSDLEVGTLFLAKDKTSADFSLMYLALIEKTFKSVKLASPELPQPRFVDPMRFCQKYALHEILGVVKDEESPDVAPIKEIESTSNEPSNRLQE